jgi:hypothetical protein
MTDTLIESLFALNKRISKIERSSAAAMAAKNLGLTYMGFGRYGVLDTETGENTVTHIVKDGKLVLFGDPKPTNKKFIQLYGDRFERHKANTKYTPVRNAVSHDILDMDGQPHYLAKDYPDTENDPEKITPALTLDNDHIENIHRQYMDKYYQKFINEPEEFSRVESSVKYYMGIGSHEMNAYLWKYPQAGDEKKYHPAIAGHIRDLDKIFDSDMARVLENTTVYNGTSAPNIKVGDKYYSRGFFSTSLDPAIPHGFAHSRIQMTKGGSGPVGIRQPVVFEIALKKGQKAININAISAVPGWESPMLNVEHEFILPRDTVLEIIEGPLSYGGKALYKATVINHEPPAERPVKPPKQPEQLKKLDEVRLRKP